MFVIPAEFSLALYENGTHCRRPLKDMAAELLHALVTNKHYQRNW
jgi:hypothetical protein